MYSVWADSPRSANSTLIEKSKQATGDGAAAGLLLGCCLPRNEVSLSGMMIRSVRPGPAGAQLRNELLTLSGPHLQETIYLDRTFVLLSLSPLLPMLLFLLLLLLLLLLLRSAKASRTKACLQVQVTQRHDPAPPHYLPYFSASTPRGTGSSSCSCSSSAEQC